MKIAKRIDVKSSPHKTIKGNYVQQHKLNRFIVVIIPEYIQILNHYVVYQNLIHVGRRVKIAEK